MTTEPAPAAARLPDWGASGLRGGIADLVAIEIAVALIAGLVVWLVVEPVVGLGVAGVMIVASQVRVAGGGKRLLRAAGARPMTRADGVRLPNVTQGLCTDLGIVMPALWIVDTDGPNAAVAWTSGGGHIAVTSALLAGSTRTEMEAVVAFCLARMATGEARRATYLAAMGLPIGDKIGRRYDVAAVAITRYPPALAAVLAKAAPRRDRAARLWMVGDPKTHEPLEERLAELSDL
jgi:hypothetical protein